MTFPRVNPLGWALFELLTSAQMNQLDTDHINAIDGVNGGEYVFQSGANGNGTLVWDFENVPLDGAVIGQFQIIQGQQPIGLYVTGDFSPVDSFGLAVDVDSLGSLTDNGRRDGFISAAYGKRANGVAGIGGQVDDSFGGSDSSGGDGIEGTGGRVVGGDQDGNGGIGVTGDGATTTSASLLSECGAGGVFRGGDGVDVALRIPGHGVVGFGGISSSAVGGAGGNFIGGQSLNDISGAGVIATGGDGDEAGEGGIFTGGVSALANPAFAGVFAIGGETTVGDTGGVGLVASGGEGQLRGGVAITAQAGSDAAGDNDNPGIVVFSVDSGDGVQIFMVSPTTEGGNAYYGRMVAGNYEGLRLESIDLTPIRPMVFLEPTALPTDAGEEGGVYFDSNSGRLAFFNGNAGADDVGLGTPVYEPIATVPSDKGAGLVGGDVPIIRAVLQRTGIGLISVVSSRSIEPFTIAITGGGNINLTVTFDSPLPSGNYVALCVNNQLLGTDSDRWTTGSAVATSVNFRLFAAGATTPEDLLASAWAISIVVYAPGE